MVRQRWGDTFRALYLDCKAERDAQNREDEFVDWLNKAADEMSAMNYLKGYNKYDTPEYWQSLKGLPE
jgi:hypothetical protein